MKRILSALLTIPVLFLCPAMQAGASYTGYIYDKNNTAVPSPDIFSPEAVLTGEDLGIGAFSDPKDIFTDDKNNVFVVDTGNNRLVMLDENLTLVRVYESFTHDGQTLAINKPEGVFADASGILYIADTANARVLVCQRDGTVSFVIEAPKSELLGSDFTFIPLKVAVDSSGAIFVLSKGVFQGMMAFDSTGGFIGFFGGNKVQMTIQMAVARMWRRFLTDEQIAATQRYVPNEYSNIYMDGGDFIFACDKSASQQVKQLNSLGVNILPEAQFGDYGYEIQQNNVITSVIADVNADKNGFISCLDMTRGKVFRYDRECNLLGVFGSLGGQAGTFKRPVSIESLGNRILVLDGEKNSVTVFKQTEYGALIDRAVLLYNDGKYEESLEPWTEIIKRNCNFELAYNGMGKAYGKLGEYKTAMKYFRLAGNNAEYSKAFSEYRNHFIRRYFGCLIAGISAVVLACFLTVRSVRKKRKRGGLI